MTEARQTSHENENCANHQRRRPDTPKGRKDAEKQFAQIIQDVNNAPNDKPPSKKEIQDYIARRLYTKGAYVLRLMRSDPDA